AREHDSALHRRDELRNRRVARIEFAIGVGDPDDRTLERVVGISHGLDEGLAQEQRELRVAVAGKPSAHAAGHAVGTGWRVMKCSGSSAAKSCSLASTPSERNGGRTIPQSGAACNSARMALLAATIGNFWIAARMAVSRSCIASEAGVFQASMSLRIGATFTFAVAEMQPAQPRRSASSR